MPLRSNLLFCGKASKSSRTYPEETDWRSSSKRLDCTYYTSLYSYLPEFHNFRTKTWVSAWFHRQNRALNRPSSPATIAASDEERKPPSKKQKRNSHEEISSDIESIHPSEFSSQTEYTDQHSNGNKHSGSNGKKLSDSNSSRRLDAVSASMEKMSTYPQRAVNTTGTTELSGKVNNDRLASGQVGGLNLAEMLISGQITGQAYDSLNAHIVST